MNRRRGLDGVEGLGRARSASDEPQSPPRGGGDGGPEERLPVGASRDYRPEDEEARSRPRTWGCSPLFTLLWRRKLAKRLAVQWKMIGSFGICCLVSAVAGLLLLTRIDSFDILHSDHSGRQSNKIAWFDGRAVPTILTRYTRAHGRQVQNSGASSSSFLVHELPINASSTIDSFLGLTSSFLLAVVTDRALLVQWTDGWTTNGERYQPPSANATAVDPLAVRLSDLFADPGFAWSWDDFLQKHVDRYGEPVVHTWDPLESLETLTCSDLQAYLATHKFVKVTTTKYYLPVLLVNPFYSATLSEALGLTTAFADLINFLLRPSAQVAENVERFRARYLEGNAVVGMQMSVMPGRGNWAGEDLMPNAQQNLFFTSASELVEAGLVETSSSADNNRGVVFLMVTDNQAQLQSKFRELDAAENVISAGLVAILGASGVGKLLVQGELQEMWLLGYCDVILTTPGSHMGILGAARTLHRPKVVIDEATVHQSKAEYPCLSNFGAIQQTSCFEPTMLLKIPPDSTIPCG